jgi:hypothetical protein
MKKMPSISKNYRPRSPLRWDSSKLTKWRVFNKKKKVFSGTNG